MSSHRVYGRTPCSSAPRHVAECPCIWIFRDWTSPGTFEGKLYALIIFRPFWCSVRIEISTQDFDTDIEIDSDDKGCLFYFSSSESTPGDRDAYLIQLCQAWEGYRFRSVSNEAEWVNDLSVYLTHLVDIRVNHVQLWISKNLESFQQTAHANITILLRAFDTAVIDIKSNTELCRHQCASCNLFCLLNRRHESRGHDCLTSHKCSHHCDFSEEHPEDDKLCGYW
jgi:hypothetical protein